MSSKLRTLGSTGLALMSALTLSSAGGTLALAQSAVTGHEEITVYAPFVVTRKVINPMMSKKSSAGLELVSASRSVSFRDLDLSKAADVTLLENRVHDAARDACNEIEKQFPKAKYHPIPENQDCVGNATSEAMITVNQLKAAAATS